MGINLISLGSTGLIYPLSGVGRTNQINPRNYFFFFFDPKHPVYSKKREHRVLLRERQASIIVENTSKTDFRLSRSPANSFCLLFPRVIVALAGLPHLPALAHVSFGDWRPTPPLLYTWGKFVQQIFIEWVKDMGVLVVVRPHSSPGRQTRTQSWPSVKQSYP